MIRLNGREYEYPDPDSMTWKETKLLERVSGKNISELFPSDSLSSATLQAYVIIAVMRADPKATETEVMEALDSLTIPEMGELFGDPPGTDAGPPDRQKTSYDEPTGTSGDATNNGSERFPAGETPGFVGPPLSPTGATSDQKTSRT